MVIQSWMRPICALPITLVATLALWGTQPVSAIVSISSVNGNNSPDTTFAPDFNHLGTFAGGSGVYLGNNWVLSAWHLCDGCTSGTFTLPNTGVHNLISSSITRLANPTGLGLTSDTDLVMFRIDGTPELSALNITTSTAAIGTDVTLIGRGFQRDTATTEWNTASSSWTELPPDPDGNPANNVTGYKVGGTKPMLWGTNKIENDEPHFSEGDTGHDVIVNSEFGDVLSLIADFDIVSGGLTHESQAVPGDSGGGVFDITANELVGIMHVQTELPNQVPHAAVNGNLTALANLFHYENQITTLRAIPEPNTLILLVFGVILADWMRRIRHV